tara:strand:- start:369 stop:605 length:237 start_codon:yes stop_codon:yes gene_type:complete
MEKVKEITKEELKKVKDFQSKLFELTQQIGLIETQKHAILHEIAGVNQDQDVVKKELENKYGSININLEDGTYTKENE